MIGWLFSDLTPKEDALRPMVDNFLSSVGGRRVGGRPCLCRSCCLRSLSFLAGTSGVVSRAAPPGLRPTRRAPPAARPPAPTTQSPFERGSRKGPVGAPATRADVLESARSPTAAGPAGALTPACPSQENAVGVARQRPRLSDIELSGRAHPHEG